MISETTACPRWCAAERCTIAEQPIIGQHRSAIEQAPAGTGLRVTGYLAKTERTWTTASFLHIAVDTAMHGLQQFALTAGEARELAAFLLRLATRADAADVERAEASR